MANASNYVVHCCASKALSPAENLGRKVLHLSEHLGRSLVGWDHVILLMIAGADNFPLS